MPLPGHIQTTLPSAAIMAAAPALGLVSLLTDISTEMVYPLIPIYLTSVLGATPAIVKYYNTSQYSHQRIDPNS
ncbi:MAG TPA: hypothetical protein VF531_07070 [Bacillota bacterium]